MRKTLLVFFLMFLGNITLAQKASNSPYSSHGIGETEGLENATVLGVGNARITMIDSTFLNFNNPASYNSLGKGQPLFSLGVSSRLSIYNEGDNSSFSPVTSLQHFALGFSFAKHFGLAIGIQPYSRRGYSFTQGAFVDVDSLTYSYDGTGSINKAFAGFSTDLLKFDSTRLSFGFNAGYLFGNVTNSRKAQLASSNQGGVGLKTYDIRSLHYDLGLYFKHQFNANHGIGVYATYDPLQNLNGTYTEEIYFATDVDNPNSYLDTNYYLTQEGGRLTNAPKLSYGFSYTYKLKDNNEVQRKYHPEVNVYGSYSTTDWSKYENAYSSDTVALLNTSKLSFGIQFTPEHDFNLNTAGTNFLSKVRYRAGFYQYTLPYSTGGEQVKDFGTTFGFGIPITVQKSLSSINFGFSVGKRGVSDQQQLNENYYGINLGVTIAPGNADRWFRKRTLN